MLADLSRSELIREIYRLEQELAKYKLKNDSKQKEKEDVNDNRSS